MPGYLSHEPRSAVAECRVPVLQGSDRRTLQRRAAHRIDRGAWCAQTAGTTRTEERVAHVCTCGYSRRIVMIRFLFVIVFAACATSAPHHVLDDAVADPTGVWDMTLTWTHGTCVLAGSFQSSLT